MSLPRPAARSRATLIPWVFCRAPRELQVAALRELPRFSQGPPAETLRARERLVLPFPDGAGGGGLPGGDS